jgi:DNA polymerase III sliding clamp (beta) subunit (PCNA family)
MTLNKKEFLKVLDFLKPSVSTNNRVQILQSVLFTGTHGITFNGSVGSSIEFETEKSFVIPFDKLYVFVKGAKSDIEMEIDENLAYLESGNSNSELPLLQSDDFPLADIFTNDEAWPLPETFISALKKCSAFSAKRSSRMEMNGLFVKDSDIFATDGMRIAHAKIIDQVNEVGIVIPNDFVKILIKGDFDEVFFDESKAVFFGEGGRTLFGNIIDGGSFPPVDKFIPEVSNFVELPKEDLKKALLTVGNFSGEVLEEAECKLNITDKEINISYEGESANISEFFNFGQKLPKGSYVLNPFHFSALLEYCDKFSFYSNKMNIIYGESETSDFVCVLALHQEK